MTATTACPPVARRAGIVDVTVVARLLEASRPEIDLDGDGVPDAPADPDTAASVVRMALSHLVLQHGQLWVAERDGVIEAASVWVPPGAAGIAEDLREIMLRELDGSTLAAELDPGSEVRRALVSAGPDMAALLDAVGADQILTALAVSPGVPADEVAAVMRATIAPALDALDGGVAAAITLVPERVAVLESAGFAGAGDVVVGAGHRLWVGRADLRGPRA